MRTEEVRKKKSVEALAEGRRDRFENFLEQAVCHRREGALEGLLYKGRDREASRSAGIQRTIIERTPGDGVQCGDILWRGPQLGSAHVAGRV